MAKTTLAFGKAQGWPFKGSSKAAVQFYDFIADAVLHV